MSDEGKQKRNHYRIEYPVSDRPTFVYKGKKYSVVDVSEKGAQVEFEKNAMPRIGETFTGTIIFRTGDEVAVSGDVMIIRGSRVVFSLSKGITLSTIMNEQRYLIKKYGDLSNK